jgi:hypothetical protein
LWLRGLPIGELNPPWTGWKAHFFDGVQGGAWTDGPEYKEGASGLMLIGFFLPHGPGAEIGETGASSDCVRYAQYLTNRLSSFMARPENKGKKLSDIAVLFGTELSKDAGGFTRISGTVTGFRTELTKGQGTSVYQHVDFFAVDAWRAFYTCRPIPLGECRIV